MRVLYPSCAGLDVHKKTVVACSRVVVGGRVEQDVETFATTTSALLGLSDWLAERGCTHVVMESTGVYWKPVWNILEGSCELILANAKHVRNVPGRKTDVKDAVWLADLLAHGLVQPSFIPPTPIRELRELTRTRRQLIRERSRHSQRIQKVLEDANIKVAGLLTKLLGPTARAILDALANGETDPERLADIGASRLKSSRKDRMEGLRGNVTDHHRFLLKLHLQQIDAISNTVADLDARIDELMSPFRDVGGLLKGIPGVGEGMVPVLIAEIGADMTRFPTAGHLVSWAGLCPRHDESAGKRRSTRTRKGAPWLKAALVQAAWGAVRKKGSYFRTKYYRLKARRGTKKAIVAVAAAILTTAYHLIRNRVAYRDLGADHFDRLNSGRTALRLVRRLKELGYNIEITATGA